MPDCDDMNESTARHCFFQVDGYALVRLLSAHTEEFQQRVTARCLL
jgi:hypothetical protein